MERLKDDLSRIQRSETRVVTGDLSVPRAVEIEILNAVISRRVLKRGKFGAWNRWMLDVVSWSSGPPWVNGYYIWPDIVRLETARLESPDLQLSKRCLSNYSRIKQESIVYNL
jgi:hypothetical protein